MMRPPIVWRSTKGGVSPCGATYFARVGKVGKTPPGMAPMSAFAQLALIVTFPPVPHLREWATLVCA